MRTALLTLVSILAFAANSILCRLALGGGHIDAASFTLVRVIAGAFMLTVLLCLRLNDFRKLRFCWFPAAALAVYMVSFSFGYLTVSTGAGALILFGAVQITLLGVAWGKGERLRAPEWTGLVIALTGLAYLLSPGIEAPDFEGSALMVLAGFSWAIYTLSGKKHTHPVDTTTSNFLLAVAFSFILCTPSLIRHEINADAYGIMLALVTGAGTSALGYVVWFAALRGLAVSYAAIVQLLVPLAASLGGAMFLSEEIGFRMLVSSVTILSGIFLILFSTRSTPAKNL